MVVVTEIDSALRDDAVRIQDIADQLTPAIEVVSLAGKHAAMFPRPAIDLMTSSAFAQLDGMTKSFKIHDDVFRGALGGLPSEVLGLGFKGVADGLTKSWHHDLFKDSGIGLAQGYFGDSGIGVVSDLLKDSGIGLVSDFLKDSGVGLVSDFFKDSGIGLANDAFKHLPVGLSQGLFNDSAFGFSPGFFSAEMKRLMEPITSPIASMITSGLADWTSDLRPALWLGPAGWAETTTDDRSVDVWLYQRRKDLRQKHEGMWDAFMNSCDPVLHAATSAVELLLRLFRASSVSESDVRAWATGTPYETVAIDNRQGQARVTWTGRALLAADRAGYDEVGSALIVSLVQSAATLQEMKHHSHRYSLQDIEPHLERVDELLSMLAWRL